MLNFFISSWSLIFLSLSSSLVLSFETSLPFPPFAVIVSMFAAEFLSSFTPLLSSGGLFCLTCTNVSLLSELKICSTSAIERLSFYSVCLMIWCSECSALPELPMWRSFHKCCANSNIVPIWLSPIMSPLVLMETFGPFDVLLNSYSHYLFLLITHASCSIAPTGSKAQNLNICTILLKNMKTLAVSNTFSITQFGWLSVGCSSS